MSSTDPRTCPHENTQPVYAYLHHGDPQAGDPVWVANDGRPVARICTDCLEQLPTGWGCTDCSWVEERAMCDPVPRLMLGRPCAEHAVDGLWSQREVVPDERPPVIPITQLLAPVTSSLTPPTTTEINADISFILANPFEEA